MKPTSTLQLLINYLKLRGGSASRQDILKHFKITKTGSTRLDELACGAVTKTKGIWSLKDDVEIIAPAKRGGPKGPRIRLDEEQKEGIALAAAQARFLKVPALTDAEAEEAAQLVGIQKTPKKLAALVKERYDQIYQGLILEALSDKPVLVEHVPVTDLSKIPVQDLLKEVFSRRELGGLIDRLFTPVMPSFGPLPEAMHQTSESVWVPTKKKVLKVLVVALFPRQQQDFMHRPKIKAQISAGNLELSFVSQGRDKMSLPSNIDLCLIFNMTSHSRWEALELKYGRERVFLFDGQTKMEEKIMESLLPILREMPVV